MDSDRFDHLARSLAMLLSRRLLAGAFGLGALGLSDLSEANKKHRHKHKKRKKIRRNAFGCVNVGKFCTKDKQCCSGICQGKKGKKTCKAHDQSTCQPGQAACIGPLVPCVTSMGDDGVCATTTGQAGYCTSVSVCSHCQNDADCEAVCGSQAACIVCPACPLTATACAGRSAGNCAAPPPP